MYKHAEAEQNKISGLKYAKALRNYFEVSTVHYHYVKARGSNIISIN